MASEIGTLIRSLESSRSKLEAELKRNEAYRALDQLEQREAAGKPLLTVSGTGLRAKLETELRDEPLYVAKRKIDEALRLLNGQRATDDASSGTAAAIASAVAAALPAVSAGRDAGDTMAEAVPQAEAGGVALAAGSAAIAAHASAAGVAVAVVGDDGTYLAPCGRCRQILWEFGGPELRIDTGDAVRTLDELLPGAFGPDDLPAARPEAT